MAEYAGQLANSADSIDRVRRFNALGMAPDGPTLARGGLRPDGGGAVTVSAGTMNVNVAPFSAWVDGGASDLQAGYPFVLDAAKSLAIAAGHATLARVDTVVVQVRDTAFDGSGSTDARVYVVQGAPGAGVPPVPQSAIPLRDINVPAGASAGSGGLTAGNLGADRRVYTAALGGIIPCLSSARPANTYPGMEIFETDTRRRYTHDGTGWRFLGGGSDPTAARAFATAATALTNGAFTTVALAGETYDYGNNFAANTYVCPRAGILVVTGAASVLQPGGQRLLLSVFVNGTERIRGTDVPAIGTYNVAGAMVAGETAVNAGDTVTLRVFTSATGVSTQAFPEQTFLTCRMVP